MKTFAIASWASLVTVVLGAVGFYIYMAPIRTLNYFQQAIIEKDEVGIRKTANLARIGEGFREAVELSTELAKSVARSTSDIEASGAELEYKLGTALVDALTSEQAILALLMQPKEDSGAVPARIMLTTADYGYTSWSEFELMFDGNRFVVEREDLTTWRVVRIERQS